MFKRLAQWWKSRKASKSEEMVTIYAASRLGPVPFRQVPLSKTETMDIPYPNPRPLKQHGPTVELARANGRAKARQWLVDNLPDECTFI